MVNRLSDATLNGMTKKQLIEYVRMCEHNYDVAEETLRQQAENVKDWRPVKYGEWEYRHANDWMFCTACGADAEGDCGEPLETDFCPNCGAKMRR